MKSWYLPIFKVSHYYPTTRGPVLHVLIYITVSTSSWTHHPWTEQSPQTDHPKTTPEHVPSITTVPLSSYIEILTLFPSVIVSTDVVCGQPLSLWSSTIRHSLPITVGSQLTVVLTDDSQYRKTHPYIQNSNDYGSRIIEALSAMQYAASSVNWLYIVWLLLGSVKYRQVPIIITVPIPVG